MAYVSCNARLKEDRCNMNNKQREDIMIESFKSVSEVVRDLDDKYQNDPQSMLRGAIHAIYTNAMYNAPSPLLAVSFLLAELQHFAEATSEPIAHELKWGRMSDDEIEEDGSDGTMH